MKSAPPVLPTKLVNVVGVLDPLLGEAIKVFVVAEEGASLTERDIRAYCARHLEDFMVPRYVEFRASLPKSGNGKTLPPTNLIISDDRPLLLPPGLRHVVTTTFEVPREERLLRATAAISQDEWIDPDGLTTLGQKQFDQMGPSARWLTRLFDVSASGFRRF